MSFFSCVQSLVARPMFAYESCSWIKDIFGLVKSVRRGGLPTGFVCFWIYRELIRVDARGHCIWGSKEAFQTGNEVEETWKKGILLSDTALPLGRRLAVFVHSLLFRFISKSSIFTCSTSVVSGCGIIDWYWVKVPITHEFPDMSSISTVGLRHI